MTEAKNVRVDFFKDYVLADLGPHAQLLLIGLKCMVDQDGCLEYKPRLFKAEIFPYYDVDINHELDNLRQSGFIEHFEYDDRTFISLIDL